MALFCLLGHPRIGEKKELLKEVFPYQITLPKLNHPEYIFLNLTAVVKSPDPLIASQGGKDC